MRRWIPVTAAAALVLTVVAPATAVDLGRGGPAESRDDGPGIARADGADGDRLVLSSAEPVVDPLAAAAPALGVHPVLVLTTTIGALALDGVTAAQLAAEVDTEVASYWSDSTGGALTFDAIGQGAAAPVYTAWGNPATCTDAQIMAFLDHTEYMNSPPAGVLAPGHHIVVYTPRLAACEFASISYLGDGGVVWINGTSPPRWVTIAHELGHTLTLGDSDTRVLCRPDPAGDPTAADGTSAQCADGVQGDGYDVMGFRTEGLPGPLNGVHLDALGLLTDDNSLEATGSATVLLPAVGGLAGKRFLVIESSSVTYHVEYRAAVGRDADLATGRYGCPYGVDACSEQGAYTGGVLVRRVDAPETFGASSYLLDAAAGDPAFDWEGLDWFVLPPGYTFTTADGLVRIDVLDTTVDGAQVRVRMPTAPIQQIVMTRDMTGDAKADVFTVDANGSMYLFRGLGTGRLGSMTAMAGTWTGKRVFAPGDWNGDGRADLVSADAAGRLWLHAGNGKGGIGTPVQIGRGWSSYRIIPAGDVNGDRRVDLLAIDAKGLLWLYPGAGGGAFGRRVQVGRGWGSFQLYAGGDMNRDGRVDILGINSAGQLFFYAGRGGGYFRTAVQVGRGWLGFTFSSGADLNGDGLNDLLGRDRFGSLWYYAGRGTGRFATAVKIATGW